MGMGIGIGMACKLLMAERLKTKLPKAKTQVLTKTKLQV